MRTARLRLAPLAACLVVLAALPACGAGRWDGSTRHWGTVREVMRFERHEGRVRLREVMRQDVHGVGAMAGLEGELLVVDGVAWVSRVSGDARPDAERADPESEATFLVVAEVPRWIEVPVERDVPPDGLEQFVRESAKAAGLDWSRPFPFVVRGPVRAAEVHVLHGKCPVAHPDAGPEHAPFRASFGLSSGLVVGFYAEGAEAVLMHHGSRVHAHGLLGEERPVVGHLDAFGLARGAVLSLPAR